MISDVNAYKDYLMMVNATPVLVRMVRESQMDVLKSVRNMLIRYKNFYRCVHMTKIDISINS